MPLRDSLRRWPRRCSRSLFFIPVGTVLLIIVLAAARINGSSIGLVDEGNSSPQAAFELRPIRSDEWHLRTPMVVRQATLDFPKTSDVGMGVHDVGVLLDFPVRSAAAIVKPNSWPYFVVGVEHAFAAEWWLTVFGPFLGVYAVLAVITRSRLTSALSGLLASAAPVAVWWTVPWLGLTVLYGGLMAAAVIAAGQLQSRRRYLLFGIGGWLGACCVTQLYPPWMIPVALLFGAIAISQLTRSFSSWKQFGAAAACCIGVFVVALAVFLREHRVALDAISSSIYPGRRTTTSGEGSPVLMFDAPFDSFGLHGTGTLVGGTNTSEASSGLMLWLPVIVAGGGLSGFRYRSSSAARALSVTLVAAMVFTAWALLPVPTWMGRLLGLTMVQGSRLVVPLTVAGALAAGLYIDRFRTDPAFRPSSGRIFLGAVSFVAITGWSAVQMSIDGTPLDRSEALLVIALIGIVTYLILNGRAALGLGGACALLLFSTARVNPVQVGLTPLTENPMLQQITSIRTTDPGARWANSNGDLAGFAVLDASGAPTATGVDLYAVPDTWHLIDPTDAAEPQWNRFANIDFTISDAVVSTDVVAPQPDLIVVSTSTCHGALQALGIKYLIESNEVTTPCLVERARPATVGERWIYEVVSG